MCALKRMLEEQEKPLDTIKTCFEVQNVGVKVI